LLIAQNTKDIPEIFHFEGVHGFLSLMVSLVNNVRMVTFLSVTKELQKVKIVLATYCQRAIQAETLRWRSSSRIEPRKTGMQ